MGMYCNELSGRNPGEARPKLTNGDLVGMNFWPRIDGSEDVTKNDGKHFEIRVAVLTSSPEADSTIVPSS